MTAAIGTDRSDKGTIFNNCAPYTDCVSEINNTKVDNTKDLDIVMPMYDLIEYSNNFSKTPRSSWQYCRDESDDYKTDS